MVEKTDYNFFKMFEKIKNKIQAVKIKINPGR